MSVKFPNYTFADVRNKCNGMLLSKYNVNTAPRPLIITSMRLRTFHQKLVIIEEKKGHDLERNGLL